MYKYSMTQWIVGNEDIEYSFQRLKKMAMTELKEVGVMAYPLDYMTPKIPGLGDVNWAKYVSALTDIQFDGYGCIEIEYRAFEASLDEKIKSVKISTKYLRNFVI